MAPARLDLAELALDRAFRWLLRGALRTPSALAADARAGRRPVNTLADAGERALQLLAGPAHRRHVGPLHDRLERRDLALHVAAHVGRHAVAQVAQAFLGLVDQAVRSIARLDLLALAAVLPRLGLGLTHQALHLVLGEAA